MIIQCTGDGIRILYNVQGMLLEGNVKCAADGSSRRQL